MKVLKLDNPSSVAEHREFLKMQQDVVILNHRPPHCVGPPIFLYHEIFSKFLDDYTNEELELQTGHCAWTIELIEIMAKVYDIEDSRLREFRDHMISLTGQFSTAENEYKSKSDGILQTTTTSGQIGFRVILEMKNEIGTGRSDPTIQAALSYAKYWAQSQVLVCFYIIECMSFVICKLLTNNYVST